MSKSASITDLGLDIRVHLCSSCVNQLNTCEDIQYLYGKGTGTYEGLPNICACNLFEPKLIGRRKTDKADQTERAIPFMTKWD